MCQLGSHEKQICLFMSELCFKYQFLEIKLVIYTNAWRVSCAATNKNEDMAQFGEWLYKVWALEKLGNLWSIFILSNVYPL